MPKPQLGVERLLIFIYTLLIVLLGLANKIFQAASGQYALPDILVDLPLIIFTYFGLIAIWGRAKENMYLSEKFWKVYFWALLLSMVAFPLIDPRTVIVVEEFGVLQAIMVYAIMALVLVPYFWGLYSYSFGKNRVWKHVEQPG